MRTREMSARRRGRRDAMWCGCRQRRGAVRVRVRGRRGAVGVAITAPRKRCGDGHKGRMFHVKHSPDRTKRSVVKRVEAKAETKPIRIQRGGMKQIEPGGSEARRSESE